MPITTKQMAREALRRSAETFTLDMPGALADYCQDSAEDRGGDVWAAYEAARYIRRGRGHTLRITATAKVLDFFSNHAETVVRLAGPGAEFSRGEIKAAYLWLDRVRAAGL